jgi:predicted mannosyl-3-phosphoglycerate phosphatase (HAD superfamily)
VARGKASVSSNPAFQIRWRDVTSVTQEITTGMTEEDAAKASRSERPFMVFVHDPDSEKAAEDDKAFQDDRVAVGARFFDCVRVSKADAAEDRILKQFAAKAPVLVFVRPNYEVAASHPSRFNASKMFDAMCATMKKDYKNSVADVLKAQKDIEKERAALEREKEKLAKLEEESKGSAKTEKMRTELSATASALTTREEALYKLEPKDLDAKIS